ncbi:MAG: hypothetical protein QNJ17_15540 [Desulfocapsaceae bacterium]|nr:hypothetical protein [Desulfocapsaceae bacterium]
MGLEKYLNQQKLPCNYMEDFSILGFVTQRYEAALVLLAAKGYEVHIHNSGAEIGISSSAEVLTIHNLLSAHGIHTSYRDIAETIYQA